jgi:predicted esterase
MSQPQPLDFIHRFVPAAGAPAAGTLLLLHGTGGNEEDLLPLGQAVTSGGWNLLSPRGQVLENGMPRFFRRLAEGVFDEADLERRANDLADFVASAAQHYRFDPAGVVAFGYSNGANIAGAVLLLRPTVLAGAVLLRAMVPINPEPMPVLNRVSVLLSAGRSDRIIPPEQPTKLGELLQKCGAKVDLLWQQSGHELSQADLVAAREWLERFHHGEH